MNDRDVRRLARRAGIEVTWRDVGGQTHEVGIAVLRAVLETMNGALGGAEGGRPPLVTGELGQALVLPGGGGRFRIALEEGGTQEGEADAVPGQGMRLPAIGRPGYHVLEHAGRETTLAIAPPRCWTIADAVGPDAIGVWGLAVQLYSLRRPGDGGLGDFTALTTLAREAGAVGAATIAISPVHAQFAADCARFSPYAPSSRAMLNVLHADPGLAAADDPSPDALLDWQAAAATRMRAFRQEFAALRNGDNRLRAPFEAFLAAGGENLRRHARFEALHEARFTAEAADWNWRGWPARLRDSAGPGVAAFAASHQEAVAFHAFLQFLADRGLAAAQRAAREAGMAIGLIADVAVGVDASGSDAWARPSELLAGLSVGAPPDLFNAGGQDWGVTGFSPLGLVSSGYRAFLDMLRGALRHAGGLRLDHVMGLARLWVIPAGNKPAEGAYLRYPLDDLLRLVRLESWRHRAIVLGEDLGTLPDGFRERLEAEGFAGLRVMWFERDGGRFLPPRDWTPGAVAMTSTHDLPTVAGWWSGTDLDWRERLGLADAAERDRAACDRAGRDRDRVALWAAFRDSGAATGEPPPPDSPGPAVDAACAHLGGAACALALLPLEDALGLAEQPNLPGTLHQHPNWRRRMPAPVGTLLRDPAVAARLGALARRRPAFRR